MNLKELDLIYEVLCQLRTGLSFKEFDDLVYEMRHMDYKMFGLFDKAKLITFAGASVQTNFYHKRHLYIFDFVTDQKYRTKGYGRSMLEYLEDYAKMAMCENIVLSSGFSRDKAHAFYEREGFEKRSYLFVKAM